MPNSKRLKSRHFLKSSLRCIELHAMIATVLCPISVSPQHKTQSSHTNRYNYSYCDIRKLKVIQSPSRGEVMRCYSTIALCMTISLERGRMHSSPSSSPRVIKPQLFTPASQKETRRAVEGSYTLLLPLPIEPQQQADGDPQPLDIRTGNPSSHLVAGRGLLAKVIERRIPAIGLRSETAIPSQQSSPLCIRHWIVGPQSVGRK